MQRKAAVSGGSAGLLAACLIGGWCCLPGAVYAQEPAAVPSGASASLASWETAELPSAGAGWEAVQLFHEGIALHRNGNFERACDCYLKGLQLDPGRVEILPYLALAWDGCAKYEEALACYDKYLSAEPNDVLVSMNRAVCLYHARQWDKAREAVKELSLTAPHLAQLYNLRGLLAVREKNYQAAVADFEQAGRVRPGWVESRINLASAYMLLGRLDLARSILDELVESDSAGSIVHNNLGVLQVKEGSLDLARNSFRAASDKGLAQGAVNLSLLEAKAGLPADPMAAASLADSYPKIREARLLYAVMLYRDGRCADSLVELKGIEKDFPGYALALEYKALALLQLGRYTESLTACEQAIVLAPNSSELNHNASLILTSLRRYGEALSYARKAYALDKTQPEIIYNLALLTDLAGENAKAYALLKEFLQRAPQDSRAKAVREHAAELQVLLNK